MSHRGLTARPRAGTRVRLTGYFLRATGQVTGDEGSKRWTVVDCGYDCLCKLGGFAGVDEPTDTSTGYEDIAPEIRAKMRRHIALANLEIVGAPPKAADQCDAPELINRYPGRKARRRAS